MCVLSIHHHRTDWVMPMCIVACMVCPKDDYLTQNIDHTVNTRDGTDVEGKEALVTF